MVEYGLEGKHVIITGANSLVGRALAKGFASQGSNLHLLMRKEDRSILPELSEAASVSIHTVELSSAHQIEEVFRSMERADVLVNNAGIQDLCPLETITEALTDRFHAVNLRAPVLLTKLFAAAAGSPDRSIINILSIEAEQPAFGHSLYDASKAALLQFTRSSALELGPRGIRVNGISPGVIDRPGIEEAWPEGVHSYKEASPLGSLIAAEDVTDAALFLSSGKAKHITGINLRVDAGIGAARGY